MDASYLVGGHVQSLLDVMPDPMSNNGVFAFMTDMAYIQPQSNNMEYLYNRSGDKVPSPLVSRLANGETLTTEALTSLALIIKTRFRYKWDKLWMDYSSDINPLDNVNLVTELEHGKVTEQSGTDTRSYLGSQTSTRKGTETRDEFYPEARKTERTIDGSYKDHRDISATRTGQENVTESFPTARKSEKAITGRYADTDTTSSTRTGTQTVTDKGETATTSFGFNSSTGVKTQKIGPDTSAGTTTETDYGTGIRDARAGAITRSYDEYKEATTESGERRMATSYGENGLVDRDLGDVTRTYTDYKETTEEKGKKRTETSYGNSGVTDELSFDNRQDKTQYGKKLENSGTDTTTQMGQNIRDLSDKADFLLALYEHPMLNNFYEILYRDIDEVLTTPIFV